MAVRLESFGSSGHVTITCDAQGDTTWQAADAVVSKGRPHQFSTRNGKFRVRAFPAIRGQRTNAFNGSPITPTYGDSGFTLSNAAKGPVVGLLIETRQPGGQGWVEHAELAPSTSHEWNFDVGMHVNVRATLIGGGDLWAVTLDQSYQDTSSSKNAPVPNSALTPDPEIEVASGHGYDDGTVPYTPVYVRNIWDEVSGSWSTEYSVTADFVTPYNPVGSIVLHNIRVPLGYQVLPWSAGGGLTPPLKANHAEITIRTPDQGILAINRDAGAVDVTTDQLFGENGRYELESLLEILQADWVAQSGTGTIRIAYSYNPEPSNT